VVCTEYGVNQFPDALTQFKYSSKEKVNEIIGGLLFTYFPISKKDLANSSFLRIIRKLFAFFFGFLFIATLIIRIPPCFLAKFLPYKLRHSLQHFINADLVIWNGRNFRGLGFLTEPYSIFPLFFHPIVCILLRKPIACIKASVWKLKNPISRIIAKIVFKNLIFMSIREEISMKNLKDLLGSNTGHILVLPDLSFYILKFLSNRPRVKVHKSRLKVGLTLIDWRWSGLEAQSRYIHALIKLINYLIKELNAEILVIPQVIIPSEDTELIFSKILKGINDKSRVFFLQEEFSVQDIINIYAELDFLIATRMHSAIFALSVGTPTLAIAYDFGAKWGILKMLGVENITLNFNEVNDQSLLNKFKWVWSHKETLMRTVQENLNKCYADVEKNIRLVKELFMKSYSTVS